MKKKNAILHSLGVLLLAKKRKTTDSNVELDNIFRDKLKRNFTISSQRTASSSEYVSVTNRFDGTKVPESSISSWKARVIKVWGVWSKADSTGKRFAAVFLASKVVKAAVSSSQQYK